MALNKVMIVFTAVSILGIAVGAGCAGSAGDQELMGESKSHGKGNVQSYAVLSADGAPSAIGISFSSGALESLPPERNTTSRCFDLDGNGRINDSGECEGDLETVLPLPAQIAGRADIPFGWAMLNWNPHGHPPEAWVPPHFDIHFYSIAETALREIRVGPCGIFMNCEDFERAIKPVPAKYVHGDHVSVDAAVGEMGNHLIDSKTPEFGEPPQPFTHTWIFGAYDGRIIFHEAMITRDFLLSKPNLCAPIKQPSAWEAAGYYPTEYCIRHSEASGAVTVSMEVFVYREAG
jgi:hypothetical protein